MQTKVILMTSFTKFPPEPQRTLLDCCPERETHLKLLDLEANCQVNQSSSHTYHSVGSAPLSAVTEEPSRRNERHVVLWDRVGVLGEIKNITQSEVAAPAV